VIPIRLEPDICCDCEAVRSARDGTGSPGHGSPGHRVSNLGPGRVGSRVSVADPVPSLVLSFVPISHTLYSSTEFGYWFHHTF